MARQVLPIVGFAAGFALSGGNIYAAQVGAMLGPILGEVVEPLDNSEDEANEPA
jgi:hypothetical protein